jgi:hypothetical protein
MRSTLVIVIPDHPVHPMRRSGARHSAPFCDGSGMASAAGGAIPPSSAGRGCRRCDRAAKGPLKEIAPRNSPSMQGQQPRPVEIRRPRRRHVDAIAMFRRDFP